MITLCYPYYNQPEMLSVHYDLWSRYPYDFQVVICDDGSQVSPAKDVPVPSSLKGRIKIFKIKKDRPWNWHAARNICAYEADKGWLILTDLDHIVSGQAIAQAEGLDSKKAYNFTRYEYSTMKPTLHPITGKPKPHPNTWCMSKKTYWKIGGYDERWSGVYGGDGSYATRARRIAGLTILSEPIYRVPRTSIGDASGEGARRKAERPKNWRVKFQSKLEASGGLDAIVTLSQEYERVL